MNENLDLIRTARNARIPEIPANVYQSHSINDIWVELLTEQVESLNKANKAYSEKIGTIFHNLIDSGTTTIPSNEDGSPQYSDSVRREVNLLLEKRTTMAAQIERTREQVNGPLAEMGKVIARVYEIADETAIAHGFHDTVDRIAMRVLMMGGKLLPISDFDGSMTHGDDHIGFMPTQKLEELLKPDKLGRERFMDATLSSVHRVKRNFDLMRQVGAQYVHFRPGVGEFIDFSVADLDAKPIILTANYTEVLEGALAKLPQADGRVRIVGVTGESVLSTHKGIVLEYFARTNPDRAIIYFDDGDSGKPSLRAKDNVAAYFALKDSKFEKACHEQDLLTLPYESYNDSIRWIQLINKRSLDIYETLNQTND